MKVQIEIECSDVDEIFAHLTVIRQQLRKEFKKLQKEQPDEQWEPFEVEDNNCYGYHCASVVDDLGPLEKANQV